MEVDLHRGINNTCTKRTLSCFQTNNNNNNLFLLLTEFQETLESVSRQHQRERRNIAPTPGVLSLQQIRQEIDKKFTQACSKADKLCQTGQQGPKGAKGALGYPGYKGEKGVPGKRGPVVLKASRELMASEENKGPQERRESREKKEKKELLVLLEQKETLDLWAHQATKEYQGKLALMVH